MAIVLFSIAAVLAVCYFVTMGIVAAVGIASLVVLIVTYVCVVGYTVICMAAGAAAFFITAAVLNSSGSEVGLWSFAVGFTVFFVGLAFGFIKAATWAKLTILVKTTP